MKASGVPARVRDEIRELAYYLEQAVQHLRSVNEHVAGTSAHMPEVLDTLTDINRLTEAATVRVLDETEAVIDDARAAGRLVAAARSLTPDDAPAAAPLAQVDAVLQRSVDRAMAIMGALEFQDLASQKMGSALAVLQEVMTRLREIDRLLFDPDMPAPPPLSLASPAAAAPPEDGLSAQALADELLMRFRP